MNVHLGVYADPHTSSSSDKATISNTLSLGSLPPRISTRWLYLPVKGELHHSHLTRWGLRCGQRRWDLPRLSHTRREQYSEDSDSGVSILLSADCVLKGALLNILGTKIFLNSVVLKYTPYRDTAKPSKPPALQHPFRITGHTGRGPRQISQAFVTYAYRNFSQVKVATKTASNSLEEKQYRYCFYLVSISEIRCFFLGDTMVTYSYEHLLL